MSKMHVLENNNGKYKVVIHYPTPGGNNSAGETWKVCALAASEGTSTILPEGTGVGQITTEEKASIEAGDVLEIVDTILVESGGASQISLDNMADAVIAANNGILQQKYKYYGYTQEVL